MKLKYVRKYMIIVCLLITFALTGCGEEASQEYYDLMQDSIQDDVGIKYSSVEDIAELLNDELDKGTSGDVSIYVTKEVGEDDLRKVNYSLDTTKGYVNTITTYSSDDSSGELPEIRKVDFSIVRSDSLYVYDYIVKGKEIPSDKENAKKIADVCKDFLSKNITSDMSDYDKELAIHDYIVETTEYGISDAGDDSEFNAYGVLVNKKAVCSGYAAAFNLLAECSGLESIVVSGQAEDDNGINVIQNHAWNQVKIDGKWYNLDVTWDDPVGNAYDMITHEYFNLDDEIFLISHSWNSEDYNKCDSMNANYYNKQGKFFSDYNAFTIFMKAEFTGALKTETECALKDVEITDESLQFIYDINGVTNASYTKTGTDKYCIVSVYINQ